jgi:hypothetical protein
MRRYVVQVTGLALDWNLFYVRAVSWELASYRCCDDVMRLICD